MSLTLIVSFAWLNFVAAQPHGKISLPVHERVSRALDDGSLSKGEQFALVAARRLLHDATSEVLTTEELRLRAFGNINDTTTEGGKLIHAVFLGDIDTVLEKLQNGVPVDVRSADQAVTPLIVAAGMGNTELLKLLLENGADIEAKDNKGYNPLITAASIGETETIKELLNQGANIKAESARGAEPVYFAAQNGHLEAARVLLAAGADIEARFDEIGTTSIIIAAEHADIDMIRLLISRGANVRVGDKFNSTALHYAARPSNNTEVIFALLHAGADVNAQDEDGFSPLEFAAWHGQKQNIEALLSRGASKSLVDNAGRTARDVLCECVSGRSPFCRVDLCQNMKTKLVPLFD